MKYNNSTGFARLLVIWGITLVGLALCLGVTLFLIERSKQVMMPIAPPLIPTAANPSDTPPEPQEVNLFLLDATTLALVPIKIERRLRRELRPRLSQVVRALIQETPPNFRNTIPRGTELNEVYIDSQQTAYLDFSSHLTDGHIGGTTAEFLTVTAILKTVFDAFPDDIKQVQILIDGAEVKTIAGHLNLSQPFKSSPIKRYNTQTGLSMDKKVKLIVGLGNPGRHYERTKHNVGFRVIDALYDAFCQRDSEPRPTHTSICNSLVIETTWHNASIILAKPMTYMNNSGAAVAALVRRFEIPLPELCIVYDDVHLDLGVLRIRRKGSDGGQKGMKSIIHHLGTTEFPRVRIGIGEPVGSLVDYVLTEFSEDEEIEIAHTVKRAVDALETLVKTIFWQQ